MIERILRHFEQSDYDFRNTANPSDPLAALFPDWVPYYRLKAAIAQTLKPESILEIGVRYGYSAAAFLHGHPGAQFTGIDLDSDSFGGEKGAIAWARDLLPAAQTTLIVGNSQLMPRFPGAQYDLIHIDGQQDGDGTFHDLVKALAQGRYILLDGYLWTAKNFRAANEFLLQHKQEIEYYFVIPGYAGELLIKVRDRLRKKIPDRHTKSNHALRSAFDTEYFLRTWRGWDYFARLHGKDLLDSRLRAILDLAMSQQPKRLLDFGCGRGEIAAFAARAGCRADGIDYSPAAIAIARDSVAHEPETAGRVEWRCENVAAYAATDSFDAAVAASLVEHLSFEEIDRLFARVAGGLSEGGLFVVHSSANRWFRALHYPRCRVRAGALETYLPPDARSIDERLLIINEQSPGRFRRQLSRHFPHVLIWLGSLEQPAASLLKSMDRAELAAQTEVFAVAAHRPIDPSTVCELFYSTALGVDIPGLVTITTEFSCGPVPVRQVFEIPVEVTNHSTQWLCSRPPYPVHLAYHWLDAAGGTTVVFDGNRTLLLPSLGPGCRGSHQVSCQSPSTPGLYRLTITLVQESVFWFDAVAESACVTLPVQVHA